MSNPDTTKTTVRRGHDGHWYYLSTDPFVDGQLVGEIRPQWVSDAIAKLPLRRPGRDDEADAIEAGIEAASEAVSALPMGHRVWAEKEYMIAKTAARVAVEDLWERMHS